MYIDDTTLKITVRFNIIMEVWKIMFFSKWVICRFYVNLPGCNEGMICVDDTFGML